MHNMSGKHTHHASRASLGSRFPQSELLVRHEVCQLLDEDMTDEERNELEEAEEVCRRFLAWDLTPGRDISRQSSVREALTEILGRGA